MGRPQQEMIVANLFNNKWGILALAGTAIYVVFDNIVKPLLPKETVQNYEIIDMPGMESNTAQTSNNENFNPADITQLFWKDTPKRDPFSATVDIKVNNLKILRDTANYQTKNKSNLRSIQKKRIKTPKLSALVSGERSKLAILNHKICQEGSYVDGFEVMKINSNYVLLKHLNSLKRITINMER